MTDRCGRFFTGTTGERTLSRCGFHFTLCKCVSDVCVETTSERNNTKTNKHEARTLLPERLNEQLNYPKSNLVRTVAYKWELPQEGAVILVQWALVIWKDNHKVEALLYYERQANSGGVSPAHYLLITACCWGSLNSGESNLTRTYHNLTLRNLVSCFIIGKIKCNPWSFLLVIIVKRKLQVSIFWVFIWVCYQK